MRCPDCGEEITEVVVEEFRTKTFVVDHALKVISPKDDSPWERNDQAFHCSKCDTLNVDELLSLYQMVEHSSVRQALADWIDTDVIAERILEEMEELGVSLTLEQAKGVWLNVLECELSDVVKETVEYFSRLSTTKCE